MKRYNDIVKRVDADSTIEVPADLWKLDKVPDSGKTIAIRQKEFFDMVYADLAILIGFLDTLLDSHHDERTALRDFFQATLRRTVFDVPEKESQIQDSVETLLIGKGFQKGVDYDREKGRVKVSIKEAVPDFILPRLSLLLR